MKVISHEKMTIEYAINLSEEIRDLLALDQYINENDQNWLEDSDYVIITLESNGKKYTMLHGFPGDSELGLVLDGDIIVGKLGYLLKDRENLFEKWYLEITHGGGNFSERMFYVNDREN